MRIIHCLPWYFPFSTGGTESYVFALACSQQASGHEVKILVPRLELIEFPYVFGGIEVDTYNAMYLPNQSPCLASSSPLSCLSDFGSKLNGFDVFHQHALTPNTSIANLSVAQSLGLKTVFTAHVPGILCLRGTMMEYALSPCNGCISEQRCGSCWAHSRGASIGIAKLLGSSALPLIGVPQFQHYPFLRRLSTLLRAKQHVHSHVRQLTALSHSADHIVAVCQWLYDAFVSNGISTSKLVLSRQGLQPDVIKSLKHVRLRNKSSISSSGSRKQVIFGFIGRWDIVKGIDVAVNAFKALPEDIDAKLIIAAVGVTDENRKMRSDILSIVACDHRILVREDIAPDRIADFYGSIDVLLVPSKWMETGPMVVLEAVAAGLTVIGSSIGGICELAEIYENIYLANPFATDSWTSLMAAIAVDASMQLSANLPVRSSESVASEMLAIYES